MHHSVAYHLGSRMEGLNAPQNRRPIVGDDDFTFRGLDLHK